MEALTKQQKIDAYTYVYLCLLAGKDRKGKTYMGFKKHYVCDYLRWFLEFDTGFRPHSISNAFPEFDAVKPPILALGSNLGWWPQRSRKRIRAIESILHQLDTTP